MFHIAAGKSRRGEVIILHTIGAKSGRDHIIPLNFTPDGDRFIIIASLGGDEFKITEVLGNMVVLTILCIIVFKLGLSMNIYVLRGVW